ncbi:MAG: helix-turn-helix domain-containing protein [Treponema sp.]|jgi:transcriptional regulator with XRE-family HTH domain|nr:helix-turn-helix domain-containing protein [Treponema sp.]
MEERELRGILSANIKRFRGLRGWSQVALAEKIGVSANFLADIETGKSWISSQTLVKLANIFGIKAAELFRTGAEPQGEVRDAVQGLVADLSAALNHSLETVTRKYLP